uniref:Uncharacterized protein n=1 Tax=Anguilla anguilla TaxID=7936 RepID=A0A0E9QGV6_ANGAN
MIDSNLICGWQQLLFGACRLEVMATSKHILELYFIHIKRAEPQTNK